ncbi:cytochrome c oxidase assembly factor 7 homolog [Thrips palmi]|uniref:Cytochrome c oxidase assembly factor 7 homolog n=1 Tax=Thrips palmi TaxID=161013 RepID=A0A6P9AB13_THRPL|nr:cytochrome c oxidase assembly factor 7 homolog [Thrips palmi]
MSTKNLNTAEEYEAYLKELRITYHFECFKENNAEACHLLGDWYAQSNIMKEAIQQYKYACEKFNYARSCYKYGVSLLDGGDVGCETDVKKAMHFTALACEKGEPEGCWRNAQILQDQRRFPEALKGHMKYCDMLHYFSHNSCYDAGLILRSPEEITKMPQDLKKAFEYFSKGCSLGNARACFEVSSAHYFGRGTAKNTKLAKEFRDKAQGLEANRE